MTPSGVPEIWLQRWFERMALNHELATVLTNYDDLRHRLARLVESDRRTDDVQRLGLARALKICNHIDSAELFAANRDVTLDAGVQMRPDILLGTEGAHYILVELKTRPGAERQGVQELLAYSTAIKLRHPYVNEFLYIVAAGAWEPLLARSVQSLILDGKPVLPLKWRVSHELAGPPAPYVDDPDLQAALLNHFELEIKLDLFDMNFVQPYDPLFAMETSTLSVTVPAKSSAEVTRYFSNVARHVARHCHQLGQSGFVLVWMNSTDDVRTDVVSVTAATVNQNWLHGQNTPSAFVQTHEDPSIGIEKLLQVRADARRSQRMKGAEPTDVWARARAGEYASLLRPQSSLSYEVLERHRDAAWESLLMRRRTSWTSFEQGGCSLSVFLQHQLTAYYNVRTWDFHAFGELEDFARASNREHPMYVHEVVELLTEFRTKKGY